MWMFMKNTPKYQPVDPTAPYSGTRPYYHTTAQSFELDQDYPNPAKPANHRKLKARQIRQPKQKGIIRFGKMRAWEKELIKWAFLILCAKWLIFGF